MQREMHNMVSRHLQAHNVVKGVRINTKPASEQVALSAMNLYF